MWAVAQKHPDVVKVLLAHGADVSCALGGLEPGDGGAAARLSCRTTRRFPHGGETALMFAARVGDLGLGEAARRGRRQRQRCRCVGRQRRDAGRALRVHRAGRVPARRSAPTRTRRRPASPRCTRRSCTATNGWSPRSSRTAPTRTLRSRPGRRRAARRRRLQFRARAGRRDAVLAGGAFQRARRDAPARETRRRSAVRAPRRARGRKEEARAFSTGTT